MKECGVCTEREKKVREYKEKIEKEKVEACLQALEREKIAKGIQNSRQQEIVLKQQQKQQMEDRRAIEMQQMEEENMWHQVLMNDVMIKEQKERLEAERRQKESLERRLAYDQQIASANEKRRELLRIQREEENRRLEKMKIKMEQDYYDAIKRKKEQQDTNKNNYIEGHQLKMSRIMSEKEKERQLDNKIIKVALGELRRDRERKILEMASFKKQQDLLIQQRALERDMNSCMEMNIDVAAQELTIKEQEKCDEAAKKRDGEKIESRQKAAKDYNDYIAELKSKMASNKIELRSKMEDVRRTAVKELRNKLSDANDELKRQMEYRNILKEQIYDNQNQMETEQYVTEKQQRPFTRKAQMFKDIMENRIPESQARTNTNPVHPFKRALEREKPVQLPAITLNSRHCIKNIY